MPELDYRDVRTSEISVGDLLAFDAFLASLPERSRDIINRKIAFEVSEGEHAVDLQSASDDLDAAHAALDKAEKRIKELEADEKTLRQNTEYLAGQIEELETNVDNLRRELSEAETRHGRELQEAEVRGHQRGRAEAAA